MTYTNWKYVEEFDVDSSEKGIRARVPIPTGEVIGIYDGEIVEYPLEGGRLTDNSQHKYIVQVAVRDDRLLGLVSETRSGIDFINHSCRPNVGFRDRIVLVADRAIPTGEVLSMDYTKWDFVPEGIRCWCNPSRCTL